MPLILGAQSAVATGYSVANSCRFNRGDSADLQLTWGTPTLGTKYTFSFWLKRCGTGTIDWIMSTAGDFSDCKFTATDEFEWEEYTGGYKYRIKTNRVFRDPSAWYHFCCTYDSTLAEAGDRQRLYINGVEETSFAIDTNPPLDHSSVFNSAVLHSLASQMGEGYGNYANEYLSEVVFIDGSALGPTSFGEFDEDSPTLWKPIDVSGLTFGDNGFLLDFEDSANLGDDVSGEANNWTEANLAAVDQCLDNPTNNFCTMNAVANYYPQATFSEGNNTLITQAGAYSANTATTYLTAGKWYWESRYDARAGSDWMCGITGRTHTAAEYLGSSVQDYGYIYSGGVVHNASTTSAGYDALSSGTGILGVYLDLDNSKLYFGVDGVVQNSGTGVSLVALSTLEFGAWSPAFGDGGSGTATASYNFGNGSFGSSALTSGNADANGFGDFEYNPSSGTFDSSSKDFLCICSANLGSDGG